ncbi:MAG: glycosyltransferase, partial [Thermodesulfobacteriota bacterium]
MTEPAGASVTVLVTSGNDGPFVAAAVDGALAQPAVAQVLVLDDGSVDDGPAALAHVSDPRVRIVCQPRRGVAHLWNLGLGLARTPWVVLLGGRDVLRPGCVAAQLAALEAEPDAVAVLVAARCVDASGAAVASAPVPEASLRAVLAGDVPALSGVLLDRARAVEAGGFDPSLRHALAQDLWLRLLLRGPAVVLADELVDVALRPGAWRVGGEPAGEDAERARVLSRALTGTRLEELLARLVPAETRAPAAEAAACLELARLVVGTGPRAALGLAA